MFRNFFNHYDVDTTKKLGEGSFGTVRRCVQKSTGLEFAVKIINTSSESTSEDVLKEEKILRNLKHPNIVVLHESFQGSNHLYLVFDLVTGGELYHDIVRRTKYSEADASFAMQQILKAIQYCHQKGVVHSDLKPQNILLASKSRGDAIKIADFGLSFKVKGDERRWEGGWGTLDYNSPELLQGQPYRKPVDIWACGVILYNLLVGDLPFYDNDDDQLKEIIILGEYDVGESCSICYENFQEITELPRIFLAKRELHD